MQSFSCSSKASFCFSQVPLQYFTVLYHHPSHRHCFGMHPFCGREHTNTTPCYYSTFVLLHMTHLLIAATSTPIIIAAAAAAAAAA
jgi:hypothetical protein